MKIALFVLFVLITGLSFMCGLAMGQGNHHPVIKIEFNPEILTYAKEFHGITDDQIRYVSGDNEIRGSFYFERDNRRCCLINNAFRSWYIIQYIKRDTNKK